MHHQAQTEKNQYGFENMKTPHKKKKGRESIEGKFPNQCPVNRVGYIRAKHYTKNSNKRETETGTYRQRQR